jgi:hypothetical protein
MQHIASISAMLPKQANGCLGLFWQLLEHLRFIIIMAKV